MNQEDIDFIKQTESNFIGVSDGYVKHIDHAILGSYEAIYRKYLDSNFVLTKWCGACVYDMMKRLWVYYSDNLTINKTINEPIKNTRNRRRK